MTLFHGTNRKIEDGTATGTFFTDDLVLAVTYARRKDGSLVYALNIDENRISDIFSKDIFGEHFVSRCFIPIDNLIPLTVGA